jgi:hypothetical protein
MVRESSHPLNSKTALERAFELATVVDSVDVIREMLKHEGYDLEQLSGPTVSRQLMKRIREQNTPADGA